MGLRFGFLFAVAWAASSSSACLDLEWKEGIPCTASGSCPSGLTCCAGACARRCGAAADGAVDAPADPRDTSTSPPPIIPDASPEECQQQTQGCYACTPGCACTCGVINGRCCIRFGVVGCSC